MLLSADTRPRIEVGRVARATAAVLVGVVLAGLSLNAGVLQGASVSQQGPTPPPGGKYRVFVPQLSSDRSTVAIKFFETDGACNVRSTVSLPARVEFLAIGVEGRELVVGDRVALTLSRDGVVVRTAPSNRVGSTLCLFGPVASQSPGGWPPGLYRVEVSVNGELLGVAEMRFL